MLPANLNIAVESHARVCLQKHPGSLDQCEAPGGDLMYGQTRLLEFAGGDMWPQIEVEAGPNQSRGLKLHTPVSVVGLFCIEEHEAIYRIV